MGLLCHEIVPKFLEKTNNALAFQMRGEITAEK